MQCPEIAPLSVTGAPYERGRATALAGQGLREGVRHRIALAEAFFAGEEAWLRRQWQCQRRHLPEICDQIQGLADGFDVPVEALFGTHIRYAIEDRRVATESPDPDGCSVFAVRTGDRRVLLAKNRDNPPHLEPLQLLLRQHDPGWSERVVLSIGSFGSAPAASSGMNSDGLCVADTAVRTADLGIGVLRYYLMEALLGRCGTVAEAIDLICSVPHIGGGNLILGDAVGTIAVIELGHSRVHVQGDEGRGWIARTNHHTDPILADRLAEARDGERRRDSEGRLAVLMETLAAGVDAWTAIDCASLLARHRTARHPALCRHTPDTVTLSGAIFDASDRSLLQSRGSPCGGEWRCTRLTSGGHTAASPHTAKDAAHG